MLSRPKSNVRNNKEMRKRIGKNDKAQAVNVVASRRGAKRPRGSSNLHKGRGLNLTRMRLAETLVLESP